MAGKGSAQRPTNYEKYNRNWERIWGTNENKKPQSKKEGGDNERIMQNDSRNSRKGNGGSV